MDCLGIKVDCSNFRHPNLGELKLDMSLQQHVFSTVEVCNEKQGYNFF